MQSYRAGDWRGVDLRRRVSRILARNRSENADLDIRRLDGTLRCYDPLTSSLLRTFKDRTASRLPARLLQAGLIDATEEDRWKVSCIVSDRESIVAAVGGSIVAWRVSEELKKKKKTGKGSGKGGFKSERVHCSSFFLRRISRIL